MFTDTHNTRTLLIPQKVNDTIIISRGSAENVDPAAEVVSSGQSQIKAFDLSMVPSGEYLLKTSFAPSTLGSIPRTYAHFLGNPKVIFRLKH